MADMEKVFPFREIINVNLMSDSTHKHMHTPFHIYVNNANVSFSREKRVAQWYGVYQDLFFNTNVKCTSVWVKRILIILLHLTHIHKSHIIQYTHIM